MDATKDEHVNPPSLSADPTKKVPRNKPYVKPPFRDVPMGRFMTYLTFGLLALVAFYMWRFTVWAHDAGGYWNLVTGQRAAAAPPSTADPNEIARLASQAREREMKGNVDRNGKPRKGKKEPSIQDQITRLAAALGIAPADLTAAIRPYLDPSVPNPNDPAAAAAAAASAASAAAKEEKTEPGLMGLVGEIVLD